MKKVTTKVVLRATPDKEKPLVEYIERARRKRENKKKRTKLLALLGKSEEEVAPE